MLWGPHQGQDAGGVTTMTAHGLADLFESGGWPPPLAAPMRLEAEEVCYAQGPVRIQILAEGENVYLHKTAFGLSPMGVAIGVGTMLGNQHRKAKASREAALRWRPAGEGVIYITDRRLTIRDEQQWKTLRYEQIMAAYCNGGAMEVQREGAPSLRLTMPNVEYYFVMFFRLAFDRVVRPPQRS